MRRYGEAAWRERPDGRDECGKRRITVRALPLPSLTFASIRSFFVPERDPRRASLPESLRAAAFVRQALASGVDLARRADHPPCCTAIAMTSFSSCPGFFPFTYALNLARASSASAAFSTPSSSS